MPRSSSPAILASLRSADFERLDEELVSLNIAQVQGLHLDVMDGVWVEETAFSAGVCHTIRQKSTMMMDVHLMVEDPAASIPEYVAAGVDRIAFHVEASEEPGPLLRQIRDGGVRPGLVLLPGTPLEAVHPWLDQVDFVNPLGVDPTRKLGFQDATFTRIAKLCAHRDAHDLDFAVQADGGVWEKTRDGLVAAGADELVGGYPIFSSDDYVAAVRALRDGSE